MAEKETALPVKYNITDTAINKMKTEYMALKVVGVDDSTGCQIVHDARIVVRDHRIAVEKTRKDLKADALEYGRKVDAEAKRITALLEPIESYLQEQEDIVKKEQERIKMEKIKAEEARVAGIWAMIATISNHGVTEYGETSEALKQRIILVENMIIDEKYAEFQADAESTKRGALNQLNKVLSERVEYERKQAEIKAEEERQAKIREEQAEAQRKIDAENKLIADEKAAQEAERKRLRDEKLKMRQSSLSLIPAYADWNVVDFPTDEELLNKSDDEFSKFKNDWNTTIDKIKSDREAKIKADAEKAAREKLEREQKGKAEKERIEKNNSRKEILNTIGIKVEEFYGRYSLTSDIDGFTYIKDPPITWEGLTVMSDYDFQNFIFDIKCAMDTFLKKKEQQEKEAREKAEAEEKARIAALAPDKEKMLNFAYGIEASADEPPALKDEYAKDIMDMFLASLDEVINTFKEQINGL
jgi:hypothetical protein